MVEDYDLTNSEWIGVGGGGWGDFIEEASVGSGISEESTLGMCTHNVMKALMLFRQICYF